MIDLSIRLRRALHLDDLVLVKRIITNNPHILQNPDFADNGNTSLHLAAQLGLLEIAEFLIDAGHEASGISRNADFETPLHLAVESPSPAVATLLATRFPRCISMQNKDGADAIMLLARTSHASLLPTILALASPAAASLAAAALPVPLQQQPSQVLSITSPTTPVSLQASDLDGNTALHYASAYGQLKCIRALLEAGADPTRRNAWSWTAVSYSLSVQAEVYFRGLVGEGARVGAREV